MWQYLVPIPIVVLIGVGVFAAQEGGTGAVPELSVLDKITPIAEHLTVVTVLLFIIGSLLREWLMVGVTAKAQIKKAEDTASADIKAAKDGADQRVSQVRTDMQAAMDRQQLDFQRQLADQQRQHDQVMRDRDGELQRMRMEVDRVQQREQQWQEIALGALGGAERNGRIIERGLLQPIEQRLRLQAPPGGNDAAQSSTGS